MAKIPYESILVVLEKHFDHLSWGRPLALARGSSHSDVKDLVDTIDEQNKELKMASERLDELEGQVKYYKELYEKEKSLHLQLQNRMDLV